jgi:putative hemolysin
MNEGSQSILTELLLIFILILINAFFAASEIAIISLNRNKISYLADEGNKKASLLLNLIQEPSKFLATIQVGITLAGFLASASAAVSISKVFQKFLNALNIPFIASASERVSLVAVTILLAFFTLVLGELLPKRLALQNSEAIAMFAVKPLVFISKITAPFVKILTLSTNFFARLLGSTDEDLDEKVTEEEIRMMINVGEEAGILNQTEREMLDGIFEFDDTLARKVMTPRTNVFAVNIDTPIEEIVDSIVEEQYSRVPVYEEEIDNVIGILYMKDLFAQIRKHPVDKINIRSILRPAYFVPETKNIDALFRELQNNQNHMAILIDEYGGLSGILTIEDLIEEIFGNIADEYDEESEDIERIDKNTYLINGLVSIDEINEKLNLKLPSDNFDTIGGFVLDLLGNIPSENEEHVVEFDNLTFKVEKVDEKRIELVKLYIQQK